MMQECDIHKLLCQHGSIVSCTNHEDFHLNYVYLWKILYLYIIDFCLLAGDHKVKISIWSPLHKVWNFEKRSNIDVQLYCELVHVSTNIF